MARTCLFSLMGVLALPLFQKTQAADVYSNAYSNAAQLNSKTFAASAGPVRTRSGAEPKDDETENKKQKQLREQQKRQKQWERLREERRRRYLMPYRQHTLNRFSNGQNTHLQNVRHTTNGRWSRFGQSRGPTSWFNRSRRGQTTYGLHYENTSRFNQSLPNASFHNQRRFMAFPTNPLY